MKNPRARRAEALRTKVPRRGKRARSELDRRRCALVAECGSVLAVPGSGVDSSISVATTEGEPAWRSRDHQFATTANAMRGGTASARPRMYARGNVRLIRIPTTTFHLRGNGHGCVPADECGRLHRAVHLRPHRDRAVTQRWTALPHHRSDLGSHHPASAHCQSCRSNKAAAVMSKAHDGSPPGQVTT